jgi:hypothetical protein
MMGAAASVDGNEQAEQNVSSFMPVLIDLE